jgi:hypothetical protein
MSCFDNLITNLKCPNTQQYKEEPLQLFIRKTRIDMQTYEVGATIPLDKNNTLWFSTDYVCNQCSKKTKSKHGEYIRTEDQSRHNVFINMQDNKILEVLTQEEFDKRGIQQCPDQDSYDFNQ